MCYALCSGAATNEWVIENYREEKPEECKALAARVQPTPEIWTETGLGH